MSFIKEYPKVVVLDRGYLRVVALRQSRDETNQNKLEGSDGKAWFYSDVCALDLTGFDIESAEIANLFDDRYRVLVPVASEQREKLSVWCREHRGRHVGVIMDGRLMRVGLLNADLEGLIEVATYRTREEAVTARDLIRQGGKPPNHAPTHGKE